MSPSFFQAIPGMVPSVVTGVSEVSAFLYPILHDFAQE